MQVVSNPKSDRFLDALVENYVGNLNKSYLLSVAGVFLLTVGSILYLTIQDYFYFIDESEHEIIGHSQRVALLTDKYFEKYEYIFSAVSKSDCVIQRDGPSCSRLFARLNGLFPMVENFAAVDRNGRFFASGQAYDSDNPPNVRHSPFFQAIEAGESCYIMNPHIGPISQERVTGIVVPLLTAEGKFDGLIGVSLKLQEIERLWEGLLDELNSNILIFDRNQILIAASRSARQLIDQGSVTMELLAAALGRKNSLPITIGGDEFALHQTLSEPSKWTIVALLPSQGSFSDYLEERSYVEITGTILTLLLGLTVIGLIRDALARARLKQAEQQLAVSHRELQTLAALDQSEHRYQELFQNAPVGLWEEDFTAAIAQVERIRKNGVKDLTRYLDSHPQELKDIAAKVVILDVNKAALILHQADSKEQLLGSLDRIFNEKSYSIFQLEIIALAEEKEFIELQGEVSTLRDETRAIIARVFRLGGKGEFGRVLIATSDVTQLKQTEEALRRSQKMDAIGQITGGIAHDFNNILGIIIGNLDLLKFQVTGEEKANRQLDTALKAALRAADLTRQLLGFSRQQVQQSEPTDLNETVREMKSLVTRSVTPAIEVVYHHCESLWPVCINRGDFKDALLNLVLNAKDAMPEGGRLTIQTINRTLSGGPKTGHAAETNGDYVVLKISDTGCGIATDEVDHIFEPFYTTKPYGKGTGLGLSMVFGFVKRAQGEVRVESQPGKGTTISLLLPRAEALARKPDSVEAKQSDSSKVDKTILVVDDERDLLDLAKSHLLERGYSVITASSGREALQRVEENPAIDILFTDIVMPGGIGGYELAEKASLKNPHLKILFTSGYTKHADQNQSGFTGSQLLNKPYSPTELSLRLSQLLRN